MVNFRSSLVRTAGIAALTASLLIGTAISASADTRGGSITALPSAPPPPTLDLTGPTSVPKGAVVLDDFTPPRSRASGQDSLKGDTGTARGGNTPHTTVDDFKGGPGCSIQCITSGIAYGRGVGANLVVKTDTPAKIWIIVWNDDGYHKSVNSYAGETEFANHFDDLEPGTTYQAMAAAEDGEGYTSHGYGEFTTLTRTVQLTFTEAIIEESPFGDDDYWVRTWLMGDLIDESGPLDPDGDTLSLGIQILGLEEAERFLSLQVELLQSDAGADLCEANAWPDEPTIGSGGCDYWAYAEFDGGSLDLDDRPNDATSWTHHTMQRYLVLPGGNALPPGFGEPLDFSILVGIEVTYE